MIKQDWSCIVCDKDIKLNECQYPDDGTMWHTGGNWGSTVYDEFGYPDIQLVCCICDECLIKKQNKVAERFTKRRYTYEDKEFKCHTSPESCQAS